MSTNGMTIHLKIWRQARGAKDGKFAEYTGTMSRPRCPSSKCSTF